MKTVYHPETGEPYTGFPVDCLDLVAAGWSKDPRPPAEPVAPVAPLAKVVVPPVKPKDK